MTFANPYNACTTCGVRVTDYTDNANVPCGHKGFDRPASDPERPWLQWTEHVDPWKSDCPGWSPVDGCTCDPPCPLPYDHEPAMRLLDAVQTGRLPDDD